MSDYLDRLRDQLVDTSRVLHSRPHDGASRRSR